MRNTIIADTSCLIVLTKIGGLDLLQSVYKTLVTTIEVAAEYGQPLPHWIEVRYATNGNVQSVLELQVDKGESSTIALALETPTCTVILDDYKARKLAEKLGLNITGTIGVIVKAKQKGVILSIRPYLDKISQTDFRLSPEIEDTALEQAGEL